MWKHVRNISGNSNDRQIPKEINIENERINEGDEVIEKLNLFFSKISEKLVSEHPQQDLPFDFDKLTSYVNSKVMIISNLQYHLMKNTDLISIIGSLDATKATGPDGITPKILKKSADIVNPSLLKIINISTNKHGDSKSDVLLCFDTKFKSKVYNKRFESNIDIKRLFDLSSP